MKRSWSPGLTIAGIITLTALAGWIASPYHPALTIGSFYRDLNVKLGLDLQGGSQLTYEAKLEGIGTADGTDAIAGVRDVIERRVNAFGISEPVIQTSHTGDRYRLIVELAGVHDPDEAIELIGQTPQLDFRREVGEAEALEQFNIDDPSAITGPIFERTELSGKHLENATVDFDPVLGSPQVNLEFDSDGTRLFADLTRENIGQRIAIYLDGVPISAPVVQSEISNGRAVITGGFAIEEANQLARNLRAGALPIPIELVGQQTIGPTLGQISVQQSVAAGVLGLFAVMTWLITYYRLPGVIASFALILYALLFLVIVKLLPVTLTLAGIAGFILSVGMAVDANVLIFERFRENLRQGKAPAFAATEGFRHAWSSIQESNISSLLTGIILYYFGTSIVRGFALTFMLGVIVSIFTAVFVTRLLLQLSLRVPALRHPRWLAVKASSA